jgi:hypothetical protein
VNQVRDGGRTKKTDEVAANLAEKLAMILEQAERRCWRSIRVDAYCFTSVGVGAIDLSQST